jgi:homoserine kinase
MEEIKVFAPATIANVACGYDVLGFALYDIGDTLVIKKTTSPKWNIVNGKGCEGLPTEPAKNVIGVAVNALFNAYDKKIDFGFTFEVSKNIKPGSGLGSSASSSCAAVFGVNQLLGCPFDTKELIAFAMEGERAATGTAHADNVAPCLFGGFTLIRSYHPLDIVTLEYPKALYATLVHPQIEVKTTDSKKIIKKEIPLKDAITQWGNLGGLIAGLAKSDYDLISRSLKDVIAEPARAVLIPNFYEAKEAALNAGALGSSISGSGPSIFALTQSKKQATSIVAEFDRIYQAHGIKANTYISKVNAYGTTVVS